MPRVVIIGHTDVGRRTCALLAAQGISSRHLDDPSDVDIRAALTPDVDGVAVLLHDDMRALRYCLVVEHVRPGIRLFVAMFDGTARAQLERAVPNCVVLSPASIAVPSMVASAIAPEHVSVRRRSSSLEKRWVTIDAEPGVDQAIVRPFEIDGSLRVRGLLGMLRGQFHPYDAGSSVLLGGAFGLLLVILIDTLVGLRHDSLIRAIYDAARTTATISAPELADEPWLLVWGTIAALLVMGFTAAFAAGIVHHLISGRHVALVGRRVMPRSGHVVVAGMGQVGLRLAQELRALGVAVVGIERYPDAPGLPIARDLGIPVVIGDAVSRRVLRRTGLRNAVAIVAASSEERDNIAVAISAQAVAEAVNVVIRAGSDDAIDETTSLFHIGSVIDVNGLTSAFVAQSMTDAAPFAVIKVDDRVLAVDHAGLVTGQVPTGTNRCACT
ncbi:MAG: NAD-binding protein [Actinobacteria bacterium]|nr:NAD-binding protein [Actinomycetota bacterium]